MHLGELLFIFLSIPLIWFWLDSMRLKEYARRRAASLCRSNNVQFLDDTVHLTSLKPVFNPRGMQLQYRYGFEFANDESYRYSGYILIRGKRVVETHMDAYRIGASD